MNGTKTFKTQSVKKGSAPSAPGTPSKSSSGSKTYTFKGWTTKDPGSSALYSGQSYLTSSQVAKTTLTANTTYYALYTSSSSSGDISYKVSAGESVIFDRSDFKELYEDACGGKFDYAVFTPDAHGNAATPRRSARLPPACPSAPRDWIRTTTASSAGPKRPPMPKSCGRTAWKCPPSR